MYLRVYLRTVDYEVLQSILLLHRAIFGVVRIMYLLLLSIIYYLILLPSTHTAEDPIPGTDNKAESPRLRAPATQHRNPDDNMIIIIRGIFTVYLTYMLYMLYIQYMHLQERCI